MVLLPYAQLMGEAQRQWALLCPEGFAPRFETTRNWAQRLIGFMPQGLDYAQDQARDRFTGAALLEKAGLAAQREMLLPALLDAAAQLVALGGIGHTSVLYTDQDAHAERVTAFGEANGSLLGLLFWMGGRRDFVTYRRLKREHGKSAWTFRKKFTYLMDSIFAFTDALQARLQGVPLPGVPFDDGTAINAMRTDYLAKAGYTLADFTDITWSDFLTKGKDVLEKTGKPMLSGMAGSSDTIMMMLQSAGASLFSYNGNAFYPAGTALDPVSFSWPLGAMAAPWCAPRATMRPTGRPSRRRCGCGAARP